MTLSFMDMLGHLIDYFHPVSFKFYFLLFAFIYGLYVLTPTKINRPKNSPPFYSTYTSLGPIKFLLNPLKFIVDTRKELKVTAFSTIMFDHPITFVSGVTDVTNIVNASEDDLSFVGSYDIFIVPGFGTHILDTRSRFEKQKDLLVRNLHVTKLNSYMIPSLRIVQDTIDKVLNEDNIIADMEKLLRDGTFIAASRNFLGHKFPALLNKFPFSSIVSNFGVFVRSIGFLIPSLERIYLFIDKIRGRSAYKQAVLRLVEKYVMKFCKDQNKNIKNVFHELVVNRHKKDGAASGDIDIMINLVNFFVIGTGLNSYNMMAYFMRKIIFDEKLWTELHEEQSRLDAEFGHDVINQEKLDRMEKLKKALNDTMKEFCFPLLFRIAKKDFALSDGTVIPKGDRIAFSPRHEHLNGLDLTFGMGTHKCPAEKYSWNAMKIILSRILVRIVKITVVSAKHPEDNALVTFPIQKPIVGKIEINKNDLSLANSTQKIKHSSSLHLSDT